MEFIWPNRVGRDSLILIDQYPGGPPGYLCTIGGVESYSHGDFASETAARDFIEQSLAETRGGVCGCVDDICDDDLVARYRTGVTVDTNDGCF